MIKKNSPLVLIILDGWGIASPSKDNAISLARKPYFDQLIKNYPTFVLQAAGEAIGLLWGEMGGSEVGHLNLGSGRVIYQPFSYITKSIWDKSFFSKPAFLKAIEHIRKYNSKLHLLGLITNAPVHGYIEHLYALLKLAKKEKIEKVYIHGILDGRDTPSNTGYNFISQLEEIIEREKIGKIATLVGRFYAMDRDNHWERIEKAYSNLTEGIGEKSTLKPSLFIQRSYQKRIFDEELPPVVFLEKSGLIEDNDVVIFFNFRADRARQLTEAFTIEDFKGFSRTRFLKNLFFVTFTNYGKNLPVEVVFPREKIKNTLAEILSRYNLTQFHIAETEKYAHVTYFFNGGNEIPFSGEDDILIPSPRIISYKEQPEMSAFLITKRVKEEINKNKYHFILVNFANPDMVAHTGDINAAIKAVEVVDKCQGEIINLALSKKGVVIVTADHGNAEELRNPRTGEIDKEHSVNHVPFIIITNELKFKKERENILDLSLMKPVGILADVAPTILKILNIPQPMEMTGRVLI